MSEVKVNKISPRTNCGTVQLGDSGDTFTIPSGATINNQGTATNFGATGSASWVTTKKTATFTATAGEGYFCDTAAVGAFTVNLPSSPSAGAVVAVADYANTFDTANLTIGRGGSNIEGDASDFVCNQEGVAITFVYVDATKGWIVTDTGNSSNAFTNPFIIATGGTESTCGNDKIHTFTGPGTFTVCVVGDCSSNNQVSYIVVAGGGGGATRHGGGGGAGGFREDKSPVTPYTASPLEGAGPITVTATSFPITVGGGGPGASCSPGSNSVFSTITSAGGGGSTQSSNGSNGGSGGGGGGSVPGPVGTAFGGNGNTPPVSPSQGFPGGPNTVQYNGGGGGGASAAGASPGPTAGVGGAGVTTSINGSSTAFAGGGGGGSYGPQGTPKAGGAGGSGGGGAGATGNPPSGSATAGTVNTGGGGGGGAGNDCTPQPCASGAGGSGIVIIRYKFQ